MSRITVNCRLQNCSLLFLVIFMLVTKQKKKQTQRAALVLDWEALLTLQKSGPLVSRCCFNLQSARMLFYLLDTPVPANIWAITILIKPDFVNHSFWETFWWFFRTILSNLNVLSQLLKIWSSLREKNKHFFITDVAVIESVIRIRRDVLK